MPNLDPSQMLLLFDECTCVCCRLNDEKLDDQNVGCVLSAHTSENNYGRPTKTLKNGRFSGYIPR